MTTSQRMFGQGVVFLGLSLALGYLDPPLQEDIAYMLMLGCAGMSGISFMIAWLDREK